MRGPRVIACGTILMLSGGLLLAQEPASKADARWAEIAVSDDTLEARYQVPTSFGGQPHSEFSYAVFLSENRDFVGSAGLLMGTELNFGWEPLQIEFGPQAYAALLKEENNDVFAISVGVEARYELVPSRSIAIRAHGYYAPDILTFGSADKMTDVMVRGEMELTDRVIIFGGYRWFRLDLNNAEQRNLQNQLFGGVRWQVR